MCCPHIEISQLIWTANQLTGFYMRAKLALNGLMSLYFIFRIGIRANVPEKFTFSWIIRKKLHAQRFDYSCWCRKVWNIFALLIFLCFICVNPFHAIFSLSIPPDNIRKSQVVWCFEGVKKETSGMKWVKTFCTIVALYFNALLSSIL